MIRVRNRRRGQTTVEFALVALLVLFPLLIGVVETGRYVYSVNAVTNGAREGARFAIAQGNFTNQDPTTTCPSAGGTGNAPPAVVAAAQIASSGVGPLVVTTVPAASISGAPPAWCQVTVSYQFNVFGGAFAHLPVLPISSSSTQYFN